MSTIAFANMISRRTATLALLAASCGCLRRRSYQTEQSSGSTSQEVPTETPKEFLPNLVKMTLPNFKFPNERGEQMHVNDFVKPWAPHAASVFGAWRTVVEKVTYDDRKLSQRWYAQTPEFTWRSERGVCIDTAILLCAWLLQQNENAFVGLGSIADARSGHAWVILRDSVKQETFLLETTPDAPLDKGLLRKLPRGEEYKLTALFNDRSIYVSAQHIKEYEQYGLST